MRPIIATIVVILVAIFATKVLSQEASPPRCDAHDAVAERLKAGWDEKRVAFWMDDQLLIELWGNEENGTWTILTTLPGTVTCMVASGHGFVPEAHIPGEPT